MQRKNLPSKKECRDILIQLLQVNVNHESFGESIRRLGQYIVEKEADKNFLVVLIRFFDGKHAIFDKNYAPPQRPSKAQGENLNDNEAMLSEYHSALAGIHSLKGGNMRKRTGGSIV